MRTNQIGSLQFLTSDLIETVHCFSTRYGGVSEGPLASLNLGVHRGDKPQNVLDNYKILGNAVGFEPKNTVFTKQIHSDIVERVGAEHRGRGLIFPTKNGCDALVTDEEDVALTVFSADCTPVLLYDPVRRAVGAAHAGWRGTAAGIAAKTALKMHEEFGCEMKNIRAAIGPCISECCFQTDADVPTAMRQALGEDAEQAIREVGEKYYVNLKLLNAIHLRSVGVETIDIASECTACEPMRFWSHRITGGKRGSLAAVIMLKGEPR